MTCYVGCLFDTIEDAMQWCAGSELTWVPRFEDDDPTILGVWL